MKRVFFVLGVLVCIRIITTSNMPLEGKKVRISGILTQEPREVSTNYLITINGLHAFVPRDPDIRYGAQMVLEGTVAGQDLTEVTVHSVEKPTSLLANARFVILSQIRSTFSEPESALVAGVSMGAPNIPKQFMDALRRTGTSHVVVASGGNLAILAGFLESIMHRFVKRRRFLLINSIILLLYAILTGFGAPIVRALFMWLAIAMAQLTGRVIKPSHALLYSILLMLLLKPTWISDVSFQLSVGATSAIMLFSKPIQKRVKVPIIGEAFSTSVAAQIGILPISIFVFHEVNLLSPLWNTLVLWTVPYLTVIGLLGSVLALISGPLSHIIFLLGYPFAWYFVRIISLG